MLYQATSEGFSCLTPYQHGRRAPLASFGHEGEGRLLAKVLLKIESFSRSYTYLCTYYTYVLCVCTYQGGSSSKRLLCNTMTRFFTFDRHTAGTEIKQIKSGVMYS